MARTMTVDLESKAFLDSIPQPATRRNWRSMILEADEVATYIIKEKISQLAVLRVSLVLSSKNTMDYWRAAESFQTMMMCDVSCVMSYFPEIDLFHDSAPTVNIKLYQQAEHTEVECSLSQLLSAASIHRIIAGLKAVERDSLLVMLLIGALGYFDSSQPLGVTPFGYLSPQMLYVVCKMIGLKVQALA